MNSSRLRMLSILNAGVLLAAVLSIGQVNFQNKHDKDAAATNANSSVAAGASAAPGASGGPSASASPSPGAKALASAAASAAAAAAASAAAAGNTASSAVAPYDVPDFGLKTEGVTAKTVTIGEDYDVSGCGGADTLENGVSSAVTGSMPKATTAFTNYVNSTGGIGGRKLIIDQVDDGGEYCPEKHESADITLVNQDHVFMDIAGLHEVSELLYKQHIPFEGGESAISAELKQGYGQFQIYQDADDDFANWASFGKQVIDTAQKKACFIHPDTADFNSLEPLLVQKMANQGLKFADILRYTDSTENAAGQAVSFAVKMKADGCQQVWLLANNAIGAVFITAAANQENWYPTWTWTSRTAAIDDDSVGGLMNQKEWANSIGLSNRVPAGKSPYQNNCANIYDKTYAGDGEDNSASTQIVCATVLTAVEAMRRAIDVTGVLTANSLMLGVNAIKNNFYFDSTVPMSFSVPGLQGPFKFTGFYMQTVAKWGKSAYDFPDFPYYWQEFGPGQSGKINILPYFKLKYTPPKR